MNWLNKFFIFGIISSLLVGCAGYTTPPRSDWAGILSGVSLNDMTHESKSAKKQVFLGSGGVLLSQVKMDDTLDYGDKQLNDNVRSVNYMSSLEHDLYNSLRKSGVSVQRAGTDVVVVLVRAGLIKMDAPELSDNGIESLETISDVLKKYPATFVEIAGYTDAMKDADAATKLSTDMAWRTALFLAEDKINPIRMFVVGRGASRPIAAQDELGRITNRRVEVRISPAI